jgi:hypothetical protein
VSGFKVSTGKGEEAQAKGPSQVMMTSTLCSVRLNRKPITHQTLPPILSALGEMGSKVASALLFFR